ncbi:RAD9, HUS1, RAD1-interacting nuclear orphan protein 1 [Engraulis encrasicolus]|uniref:RAD9, HUS1, RAD1-interacting nuclear orphan protein 1 n=1 Tax=Engraulis encrasicolus TaxID=184585 RepID=UPI002FD760FB
MSRNTRKRRLHNPNKSRLTFVEAPISGDIHQYGPQLRSAINPRSFISEEPRQNGTAWVSPQFDQIRVPDVVPRRTRRCHSQSTTTTTTRHNSTCTNVRKSAASKYPPLAFDTGGAERVHGKKRRLLRGAKMAPVPESNPASCGPGPSNTSSAEVDIETPQRRTFLRRRSIESALASNTLHPLPHVGSETPQRRSSIQRKSIGSTLALHTLHEVSAESRETSASPAVPHSHTQMKHFTPSSESRTSGRLSSPNVGNYTLPPDIDTPEMPHKAPPPASKVTFLDLLLPLTPPHSYNLDILVEDTPERDYGLKVTWRKRKNILRSLIRRGLLTSQQAEVVA